MKRSDSITPRFINPHTAVPDWLAFHDGISHEARTTALAIIVMSKGALPPLREDVAERLGVDVRTVDRRLAELRENHLLVTERVGKRSRYLFVDPKTETCTPDMGDQRSHVSDLTISPDMDDQRSHVSGEIVRSDTWDQRSPMSGVQYLRHKDALERTKKRKPVHGGGGGDLSSLDHDPNTNTKPKKPLQTAHARYMLRRGIFAAAEFDNPEYDSALWIKVVAHYLDVEVLSKERTVTKLRLDPPQPEDSHWHELVAPAPAPAPVEVEPVDLASYEAAPVEQASEPAALWPTVGAAPLWPAALGIIRMQTQRQTFADYIAPAKLASFSDGVAQIVARNLQSKAVLEQHVSQIRAALMELTGEPVTVRIVLEWVSGI